MALDQPETNAAGEFAGGVDRTPPLDIDFLQSQLNAARASGVEPRRYKALLHQYWIVKAVHSAGINLNTWDPQAGVRDNLLPILRAWMYYGRLFREHPELQWAGMANMIAPSFLAGFLDISGMQKFVDPSGRLKSLLGLAARTLGVASSATAPAATSELAQFVGDLARIGTRLSSDELRWFENKFLAMQKHIFFDQAAMHEAYLAGANGPNKTQYINEMAAAGLFDDDARPGMTQRAWQAIADPRSSPNEIMSANEDLLYREQNVIIKDQYNQIYNHDGPVGRTFTYLMTLAGSASIPGTKTPGEYRPVTISFRRQVKVKWIFMAMSLSMRVRAPFPDFNITNAQDRWTYISDDTLPAYKRLLHQHPKKALKIVRSSILRRTGPQRLVKRLKQLP